MNTSSERNLLAPTFSMTKVKNSLLRNFSYTLTDKKATSNFLKFWTPRYIWQSSLVIMIMPSFCKRPFAVKWILLSDLGWFLSPNYMINHLFWLLSVSGNFLLHRMNLNVTKKHIQTTWKPFGTVWGDFIFPVWWDWNVDFILYCVIMIMPPFRATRWPFSASAYLP